MDDGGVWIGALTRELIRAEMMPGVSRTGVSFESLREAVLSGRKKVDTLSAIELEELVGGVLSSLGYEVAIAGQRGAPDLVASKTDTLGQVSVAVDIKRGMVKSADLQTALYASEPYSRMMIVSPRRFTADLRATKSQLDPGDRLILVDADRLVGWLSESKSAAP
jgi:hypothetical protein